MVSDTEQTKYRHDHKVPTIAERNVVGSVLQDGARRATSGLRGSELLSAQNLVPDMRRVITDFCVALSILAGSVLRLRGSMQSARSLDVALADMMCVVA